MVGALEQEVLTVHLFLDDLCENIHYIYINILTLHYIHLLFYLADAFVKSLQ